MKFSCVTGADQLAVLELHDHGRPFAAVGGSTTKCCGTGTCGYLSTPGGPVERIEMTDPARLAATLGSLDSEVVIASGDGH